MITVALNSSKLPAEEKPHLPTKMLIKQTSFVVQPWKYSKDALFSYKTFATTITETESPKRHRQTALDPVI